MPLCCMAHAVCQRYKRLRSRQRPLLFAYDIACCARQQFWQIGRQAAVAIHTVPRHAREFTASLRAVPPRERCLVGCCASPSSRVRRISTWSRNRCAQFRAAVARFTEPRTFAESRLLVACACLRRRGASLRARCFAMAGT